MRKFSTFFTLVSLIVAGLFCNRAKAGSIISFGGEHANAISHKKGNTNIEPGPWPGSTTDITIGAWDAGALNGNTSGSQTLGGVEMTITAPDTINANGAILSVSNPETHGKINFTVSFDTDVYLLGWHTWAGATGRTHTVSSDAFKTASAATFGKYQNLARTTIPTHDNVTGVISGKGKNDTVFTNDKILLLTAGTEFTIVSEAGTDGASLQHITVETVSDLWPAGDINRNGSVNREDLAIFTGHYGETEGSWGTGDFDSPPDGATGLSDLALLQTNFGTVPVEVAAVPEPSSLLLLLSGLACCRFRRRRSR